MQQVLKYLRLILFQTSFYGFNVFNIHYYSFALQTVVLLYGTYTIIFHLTLNSPD